LTERYEFSPKTTVPTLRLSVSDLIQTVSHSVQYVSDVRQS